MARDSETRGKPFPEPEAPSIVVVGDLYLDEYLFGRAIGVSPEKPVLRVVETRREHALGAAGNVAAGLRALGARVSALGVLGDDEEGARVRGLLERSGVDASGVLAFARRRTGTFTRVVVEGADELEHHEVRLDRESGRALEAQERKRLLRAAEERLTGADALFLADYDESRERTGVLGGEVLDALVAVARRHGLPVAASSRLRAAELPAIETLFVNRAEAVHLGVTTEPLEDAARSAASARRLHDLVVTLGGEGAVVAGPDEALRVDPFPAEVADTCGAGDSFAAAFLLARLGGGDRAAAGRAGAAAASVVVGRRGTSTVSAEELREVLRFDGRGGGKLLAREELCARLEGLRRQRTIVFTNGCFDLFHAGHVELLRQARACGDLLVVGLNSDRSTRENKGEGRPLLGEADRVAILASLSAVDYVTVFDELTPISLIRAVQPDVLVKGGSYRPGEVVGKDLVEARGGRVVVIPQVGQLSTTRLIQAIKEASDGTRGS